MTQNLIVARSAEEMNMIKVKFYDILGVTDDLHAANIWPRSRIKSATGFSVDADPTDLVHYLQSALEFRAVRPGADTDRVGLYAEIIVNNPPAPLIRPLVLTQMPDIAFYLQNTPGTPGIPNYKPARLYVTLADTGTELVIEGLPVEIQLPTSLLGPLRTEAEENANPGGGDDITLTDTFQPGIYDSLQVTLRDTNYSSIFVHLKVRMTEEMDFIIEPAVPISIGPCRFSGLPCHGLHDLNLFASPSLQGDHSEGEQALEWTRHPLDRLSPDASYSAVLTVRTVDLDSSRAPLKELAEKMNDDRSSDDRVEFVLEDIALPFFNLATILPIPSHGLFGLRRKIEMGSNPGEAYAFSGAPVQIKLGKDLRLLIDQFLLQTPASLNPLDPFIFVQMALLFGSNPKQNHAATIGVTDEWTIQAGWHSPTGLTLFTIADATIKLWGAKVGWSIKRFASKNPHYKWYEQLQLLVDLGLSTKGTTIGGAFKMRSLSGKDLEVVLRDVGWNLGGISLGGLSFPEGVQLIFGDTVKLIVEEVGWITENNGGRYLSFSGGVSVISGPGQANRKDWSAAIDAIDEKGKGGGMRFRRLRFLIGGNPNAPGWLLDGMSLSLKLSRFSITGFGMISEFTEAGHEYKEFGFGIQVEFDAIAKHFLIGMQLFYGQVRGPTDNFTYWLFGFQFSPIPIGTFELVNIRMLLAGNMIPNLPPPDGYAQNMRLFRWYKDSGNAAITIPPNRKLAAWIAKDDSFAAGLGAGLSLPVGNAIVLDLFLFFHKSPEESGLLIALEVYVLKSPKPVGYGALEFDFERDKWGFMIGVALSLDNVLPDISIPLLSRLISLTGSLYAGNKPGTFAIGQLNDQATWLSFRFDASAFINIKVLVALCVQLVDMPDGPRGFGLVISGMGGANFGIGKVQVYFAFGLIAGVWRNESKVSGFVIWIEAGLRIKVFWVFNFGASVKVEFDYLGPSPTYRRLGCEVRIETPWWLPDVTFRFEKIWKQPKPEDLGTTSSPLTSSGGINPGTRTQENVAVTPLIGTTINEREVYSMNQLRALGAPSLPAGTLEGLTPVGVDSIIALNFKPAVDDNLSVGENTPPGASTQKSNDLTATYELVEIAIRRNPRFGAGAGVWTTLLAPEDTRLENLADFPSGPDLEAHFTSKVSFQWDKDLLKEDRLDPRRLLINAETPYTFLTHNPESDESIGRNEPGWPCCSHKERKQRWHELNFMDTSFGIRAKSYQTFSESGSTLHWIGSMPPIVAPGQTAPAGGKHVARIHFADRGNGVFATISFDQPAIIFEIYAYWLSMESTGAIIVEAYNGLKLVNHQAFLLSHGSQSGPIRLEVTDGITSVLLRYKGSIKDGNSGTEFAVIKGVDWVEFVEMRFRGLREELDRIAREQKCKAQGTRALEGGGKLAWLPNHDYEISLTTKVILDHVKTGPQEARIKQKAFFRTKGVPGLNAVARIGDELEPFVESRYPGSAPRTLYRTEPVALAFNEKFNILLPVDRAPSPDNPAELNQLLEWVLAIDKVGYATGGERISQTGPDWVVAHRIIPLPFPIRKAVVIDSTIVRPIIRQAVTRDPFQMRFETMLHRPTGCNVPGPSLHRSQVLFHEPVDPGAGPSDQQRWETNSVFRVNVRRKDSPFVERNPFDDNDYTAFDVANEGGGIGSDWSSLNGIMHVSGSPIDGVRRYAVFGESNWNHIQIHTAVDPEGGAAGVAMGVSGLPSITRAVMALVDERFGTLRLIERRDGILNDLDSKPLPAGAKAPYMLEVFAFDDSLRVRVGETVVEAQRMDVREGWLALVAQDGGAFTSLVVESLDAYRFDFQSSRYINFEEHIGSFGGEVTAIPADAAGPGATTNTVASLLTTTASEISTVMDSGADPEERQRLFDRWVGGLALPLRHHIKKMELSRLIKAGGIELLLLESPEPLPFSEDVTLTLMKRTFITPSPIFPHIPGELIELAAGLDFFADSVAGRINPGIITQMIKELRWLVRSEKVDDGLDYHVYDVRTQHGHQGSIQLSGKVVEKVSQTSHAGREASPLIRRLAGMQEKEIALLDNTGKLIISNFIPVWSVKYVAVPIRVLTNGRETQALIIPVDTATNTHAPLTGGTYRFDFKLDRPRFRTQTPDGTSNYRAQTSIITRW